MQCMWNFSMPLGAEAAQLGGDAALAPLPGLSAFNVVVASITSRLFTQETADSATFRSDDLRCKTRCRQPAAAAAPRRRGFVKTSLGAGFAAAVLPVQAQTMITTDTQGLTAGEVRIPVADGEMPAYRAHAGRQDRPAGRAGRAGDLRRPRAHPGRLRRLAKLGYLAVAPELLRAAGRRVEGMPIDADPDRRTSSPRCPMRRSWPTSMRRPRGRRRMAAAASSASPASAGADASSGCTPHTTRTRGRRRLVRPGRAGQCPG